MSYIKEFLDNDQEPIVLVTAFNDNGLLYMVDDMVNNTEPMFFHRKNLALDYAQAVANRIIRNDRKCQYCGSSSCDCDLL